VGTCVDIEGAADGTYLLLDDDVGSYVRVVVTGTNDTGSETSASEVTAAIDAAPAAPVAPANTVPASVSGSAVAGQTLTADPGTWTGVPAPTLTYQWQRCSDSGDVETCVDIEGATDAAYLLGGDDLAAYVRVVVTATNDSGSDASASELTAAVQAAPAAPANTVAAAVSGAAVAGEMLTADPGSWGGVPAPTLTYQWQRCSDSGDVETCVDIEGATGSTYLLVDPDDVGSYVRVVVTGTNGSGSAASASALTAAVDAAPAAAANTVAASVSGSAVAGQTLTADPGTWTGVPAPTLTYQWQRCSDSGDVGTCVDIGGATDGTYQLVDGDVASYVRVVVTGTNDSGSDSSGSAFTAAVDAAPAAPANSVAASVSGSAVAGQVLTADPGTWTGVPAPTLTYQWQRCSDSGDVGTCVDIEGATGSTYLLVDPDDVGSYFRVVVTGTNGSGSAASASALTAAVEAAAPAPVAPANTVAASVGGFPIAGETLTADPGTWTGVPAPTLTYQWQRCSDSGDVGTCADIEGATDSTYVLVDPDDVGFFLRVVVTGTNDSGSETSASELTDQVAGS
jgi:hypothetical protein